MNIAARSAREVTASTVTASRVATGRSRDRDLRSLVFMIALWFSQFVGIAVLIALIVDTALQGAPRFDSDLLTSYGSVLRPEETGFRAGILGTVWLMVTTAVLTIPLGIAAAVYLEEFADPTAWHSRLIEVNIQNLAAVPSIVYGLLAVAALAVVGFTDTGVVLGGAVALGLLILPVIVIATREAVRAVPAEIRHGSLALGATVWQTTWRQVLPSAVPGIATGTILGLSRAIGEAAPLLIIGIAGSVLFDPDGLVSPVTALPIQIYDLTSRSREELRQAASAAIVVLLVLILSLNALAIFIRDKFQRTW